ncbi:hypothetical protein [Asticcacaulis sp.]|uniref:hypothetical protein n=1 Tax=Asticcacaulis sp. TaxID=1872648 RepID=UPI003F7B4E9A
MTEVQGLNKWERQVRRIPGSAKQTLRDTQGKNAERLANSIRAFVPRGKTNKLFKSINWRRGPMPGGAGATGAFRIRQKILTDRQLVLMDDDLLVTVYEGNDDAYYAKFVEHGTKASVARDLKQTRAERARGASVRVKRAHHATKAKPHFYPVIRAYKDKIRRSNAAAANRGIKKAVTG